MNIFKKNYDWLLENGGGFRNPFDKRWWIPLYACDEKEIIEFYNLYEDCTDENAYEICADENEDPYNFHIHKQFRNAVIYSAPLLKKGKILPKEEQVCSYLDCNLIPQKQKNPFNEKAEDYIPAMLQFTTPNCEVNFADIGFEDLTLEDKEPETDFKKWTSKKSPAKNVGQNDVHLDYFQKEYEELLFPLYEMEGASCDPSTVVEPIDDYQKEYVLFEINHKKWAALLLSKDFGERKKLDF
jgi:hypothetical protein